MNRIEGPTFWGACSSIPSSTKTKSSKGIWGSHPKKKAGLKTRLYEPAIPTGPEDPPLLSPRDSGHVHRTRGIPLHRFDRALDQRPRIPLFEHLGGKRRVQRVPAPVRDEVANDRMPNERHIANHVQNLVANELIVEPQRVVQHAGVADDDRVLERTAKRQPLLSKHLHFFQEREGARRCDLVHERIARQTDRP